MAIHISRIRIKNFRNFKDFDVSVGPEIVVVGENKVGKSNLLEALRLVLDPTLGDTARQLRMEDFWDGLGKPAPESRIEISVDIAGVTTDREVALLGRYLVNPDPMVARLTYVFEKRAEVDTPTKPTDYVGRIFGGEHEWLDVSPYSLREIPLEVVQAMRNSSEDLTSWKFNPLRPIIEDLAGRLDQDTVDALAIEVQEASDQLLDLTEVQEVSNRLRSRIHNAVGAYHGGDYELGLHPSKPGRLVRALRVFFDDRQRGIGEASSGSTNLVYLILKEMQVELEAERGKRLHTLLAIEEPEAHLHPHLQRLVYRRYLHARGETDAPSHTVIVTTHSPHIASVAPLRSLVFLRAEGNPRETKGYSLHTTSLPEAEIKDLERYFDATRSEMVFARGVLFVEGASELILARSLAAGLIDIDLDRLGISVVNISGTHFGSYYAVAKALGKPFAILTDADIDDDGNNPGAGRALALLGDLADAFEGTTPDEFVIWARNHGVFVGGSTFELDLLDAGNQDLMAQTLLQTTDVTAAKTRASAWLVNQTPMNREQFLKDIVKVGKARYAQRLAQIAPVLIVPPYIEAALQYLKEFLDPAEGVNAIVPPAEGAEP